MKTTIHVKLLMLLCAAIISSCTIEEPVEKVDETKDPTNLWIEETMREWYLWEDEIPAARSLDYKADAETFFYSLLSDKDGKERVSGHYPYSSINKKRTASKVYQGDDYSFGFEYQYYNITNNSATLYYALQVLYVLPNSPASEKGMKRGDWVLLINEKPVPSNAMELLQVMNTSATTETVFGLNDELPGTPTAKRNAAVTPRMIIDNPVFVDTTYTYKGRKISYLAFNHFTAGATDNDDTFHNSLRAAFTAFKGNGTEEFILDLRYNQGGLVKTAQLLTTMLAPATALNDVFCRFSYNKKYQSVRDSMLLDTRLMNGGAKGANLDMKRIFVITSSRTASASEAVINCLEPYMKGQVILVGAKTEGKNVASSTFSDDKYEWELHPIISKLSNKDDFSDYSDGFQPTYSCTEAYQDTLYDMGDAREFILMQILNYIADGKAIESGIPTTRSVGMLPIPGYSSVERRGRTGMEVENGMSE